MASINFHTLSPTQFENLAYDLLTWRGMRNTVWRTPGADGGRDLEGSYEVRDISGEYQSQKWYVDCKRYKASVDWPTVHEKVSYADNHGCDFLLLVCTPSVSPNCRSEIGIWNKKDVKTKIRVWEPHFLEQLLIEHPEVAIKHGFRKATLLDAPGFLELAIETSKCADAAYSRSKFESSGNVPELELASSLSNFLSARMLEAKASHLAYSTRSFNVATDGYDWLTINVGAGACNLDVLAIRALLCLVRLAGGGQINVVMDLNSDVLQISHSDGTALKLRKSELKLVQYICLFAALEYNAEGQNLILKIQK